MYEIWKRLGRELEVKRDHLRLASKPLVRFTAQYNMLLTKKYTLQKCSQPTVSGRAGVAPKFA